MGGKIVTLAVLEGTDEEVAKDVAMQIAAMRPLYLDKDSVPTERVEKEKEILEDIKKNFEILGLYNIKWNKENFSNNL